MDNCNVDKLVALLDHKLSLDEKLDVYDHLDVCEACRNAIYDIKRNRDEAALFKRPFKKVEK